MAIYTTFFICKPDDLLGGFPGWRLPLAKPIQRQVTNPFTKQSYVIESREPEWSGEETAEQPLAPARVVVSGHGNYEDYLESRLPPLVRSQPHWCAKGLTSIELDALGEVIGHDAGLEEALFCPPQFDGGTLQQFRPDFVSTLASLDDATQNSVANGWAEAM